MPKIPLVQLMAEDVRKAAFSEDEDLNTRAREVFAALLYGVPLRYSCPFPLLTEETEPQRPAFQQQALQFLSAHYIKACQALVRKNPYALEWGSPAPLFEQLFVLSSLLPRLILYPGYASGDMYGVGASMLLDPKLCIRIVSDEKKDRIDRAGAVTGLLNAFIQDKTRITQVKTPGGMDARAYPPPVNTAKPQEVKYLEWLSADLWKFMEQQRKYFLAMDLFFGTNYIAQRFTGREAQRASRKLVRQGWEVESGQWGGGVAQKLADFLKGKGFKTGGEKFPKNQSVIILWVRFTGKTGGAHVEYDTSFEGLRQLLRVAREQGNDWAIIVGDKPKVSDSFTLEKSVRRKEALSRIVAEAPLPTVDLSEFWQDDTWKAHFKKRIDQFKLFEVLHYHNHVKHLGARSGNLESLALLGYNVRYFEDKYQPGSEALDKQRMESWHQTVGYQRIQIDEVPTRSGKYILGNNEQYPRWTYDKRIDPDKVLKQLELQQALKPVKSSKKPVKAPELSKKDKEKVKPNVNRLLVDPFALQTLVEYEQATSMGFEQHSPNQEVLLFDIRRSQPPPRPIFEKPIVQPEWKKGFTPADLVRLGQFLKPDKFFKLK